MLGELEDAMVKRIQDAQASRLWLYQLSTIEPFAGQIDEHSQSTFKFSAVFPSFVEWKPKHQTSERGRIIAVHLMVYVAARNPRNGRAARAGDQHEAGSYQIAEDMIALLENQRLGMPMHHPLVSEGIKTIFIGRKQDGATAESVLALPFVCEFGWQASLPECANVTQDDWLRTGQKFYLPGDDQPDLSTVIDHTIP